MVHRTRHSGLRVAAGMRHVINGPAELAVDTDSLPDVSRVTVAARLRAGQRLQIS
ncbi:MAG: hypothetical protein ACRD0K_16780 [Egibacteraceae bacterium]